MSTAVRELLGGSGGRTQVFQREENMNCSYICRLQKLAAILPPAFAERLRKKALNAFTSLRDVHNLNGLLEAHRDF